MEAYRTGEYRGFTINWEYDTTPMNPRVDWDCNLSHMICWHSRYNLGDDHSYNDREEFVRCLALEHLDDDDVLAYMKDDSHGSRVEFSLYSEEEKEVEEAETNGYVTLISADEYVANEYVDCDNVDEGTDYFGPEYFIRNVLTIDELIELLEKHLVIHTISIYDHSGISIWIGEPNDRWDSGVIGYIYQTKKDTLDQIVGATEENWADKAWECMEGEMKVYDQYVRGDVFGFVIEDEEGDEIDSCWGYFGDEGIDDQMQECRDTIDAYIEKRAVQKEIEWEENIIRNCLDFTYA